jgi:hypothetical protein
MTAIEKAKELVDKFYQEAPLDEIKFYSNDVMAKSCALIAVDEIIDSITIKNYSDADKYDYWNEVKHEINKI